MSRQFTLGRNERLKSRKRIEQLFSEGRRLTVFPFRVSWLVELNAEEPVLQFAIGVSARHFRKAVDRNRIKRLAREAWRVRKIDLREIAKNKKVSVFVFLTYSGKVLPAFEEVDAAIARILVQLEGVVKK